MRSLSARQQDEETMMLRNLFGTFALTTILLVAGSIANNGPFSAAGAVEAPRISAGADTIVGEGDGFVDVPVTLSEPGQTVVTVTYSGFDNAAFAPGDYSRPGGTLTFAPG